MVENLSLYPHFLLIYIIIKILLTGQSFHSVLLVLAIPKNQHQCSME